MYRILSLDGGGIRGVLTAILLERLEAARPGFLASVDLFAGTSAGGILALGLASGLTATQARQLFEEKVPQVFVDSFLDNLRDLGDAIGAQYSLEPLKRLLTEQFRNQTLGELPKRVLISSFDLDNEPDLPYALRTWKAKFFHNFPGPGSDVNERVVNVALRSSAAPTYFPVYQGYIDGGVVAVNPGMAALAQVLDPGAAGQRLLDVRLLSVGTGRYPRYLTVKDADWGWVQWARPLLEIVLGDGSANVADFECRQILGRGYQRLNPTLPEPINLDAVDKLPLLKQIAEQVDLMPTLDWLRREWM